MADDRFTSSALAGVVVVVVLVMAGCGPSKPLPDEADVPEEMLFQYPGAEKISGGSLPASDDDYIDTGGSHEPLEVSATYRLPEPVPRDKIFDWMLTQAKHIGLEDCSRRDDVVGSSIDGGQIVIVWLACGTEAATGYRGRVSLEFSDGQATSSDGLASEYTVVVYLHAW